MSETKCKSHGLPVLMTHVLGNPCSDYPQSTNTDQQLIHQLTKALDAVYPSLDCNCYGKHDDNCAKGKAAAALATVAKERTE